MLKTSFITKSSIIESIDHSIKKAKRPNIFEKLSDAEFNLKRRESH